MASHSYEIPLTKSAMPLRQTIAVVDIGGAPALDAPPCQEEPTRQSANLQQNNGDSEPWRKIHSQHGASQPKGRSERLSTIDNALRKLDGLTLLEWCVRRLSESEMIDAIIITGAQQLRDKIRTMGLGDARWIPSAFKTPALRAMEISERFQAQWVVFASPLCPFTDPTLLDRLIATGWANPDSDIVEYLATKPDQFPDSLGLVHEMCSIRALEKLRDQGILEEDGEVPGLWRRHPDLFLTKYLPLPHELESTDARFRVESVEDWDRANRVLEASGDDFCWRRLVDVSDRLD